MNIFITQKENLLENFNFSKKCICVGVFVQKTSLAFAIIVEHS